MSSIELSIWNFINTITQKYFDMYSKNLIKKKYIQ